MSREAPAGPAGHVTVVIVHYDTPQLLPHCLEAVAANGGEEVIATVVVDNGLPDRGAAAALAGHPGARLVSAGRNLGFAAGANLGMRTCPAPYYLLLNPDAQLLPGALPALLACMGDHPSAGVAAPRLHNPDDSLQWSCRRFPTVLAVLLRALRLERWWRGPVDRYLMRDWDHAQRGPVDWAIGACLLLRQAALEVTGPLDEGFFLYYEDTDLCYRMRQAGWQVYYQPAARVRHEHRRASAASLWPGPAARAHLRSLVRLCRKHRLAWW